MYVETVCRSSAARANTGLSHQVKRREGHGSSWTNMLQKGLVRTEGHDEIHAFLQLLRDCQWDQLGWGGSWYLAAQAGQVWGVLSQQCQEIKGSPEIFGFGFSTSAYLFATQSTPDACFSLDCWTLHSPCEGGTTALRCLPVSWLQEPSRAGAPCTSQWGLGMLPGDGWTA